MPARIKLQKYDLYIFLSKGKLFKKLYTKLKDKNKILDPFLYYSN